MKKIELNIKETGKKIGTCKGVADYISNLELRIVQDGEFRIQARNTENRENWFTVAMSKTENHGEWQEHNGYLCLWESYRVCPHSHYDQPVFIEHTTPAADYYIWQFIEQCVDALDRYINTDKEIEYNLEIVKKAVG